jgi:hypothetical protein
MPMITTNKLITVDDIPSYWVFETYCNLSEKLTGQNIKIKSVFNPSERTPSFALFVKDNQYRFNDFSSGKYGSKINFIMYLYNMSFPQAVNKLISDYTNYLDHNSLDDIRSFKKQAKYKINKYTKRPWTRGDANFWTQYNINSNILEKYNVIPVGDFVIEKEHDDKLSTLTIAGPSVYAYCRSDGTPYKMYQPENKDHKFFKVKDYIQGTDQLKFEMPNLIICSSLKDIMSLSTFGFNAEFVAPDSENTSISNGVIIMYQSKYKKIVTLFDNDDAGRKAMSKYEADYGIPGVVLPLSKDLSDSVRDHGLVKTREVLYPLLKEAINK